MFSYHPVVPKYDKANPWDYRNGFKTADVSVERMSCGISKYAWSPNVWEEGKSLTANWRSADWLTLDFDNGAIPLTQAVNIFCDTIHIIGTTANHQKDKFNDKGEIKAPACDRFRVAIKFAERISDLRLYSHQLRLAEKKYSTDPACKDGARFFFPCKEIVSLSDDGYFWEIDHDVPKEINYAENAYIRAKGGVIPRPIVNLLKQHIWKEGERNTLCFRVGAALGPIGYSAVEVCHLIYASPTYKNAPITDYLAREIHQSVSNGIKRALEDIAKIPQ